MTKQVPEWFNERLKDVGGLNPHGEARLRVVWAPDVRIDRGVMKGRYQYPDAENSRKPLECFVLETWIPPDLLMADWNAEILGAVPGRGIYGMVCPLVVHINEDELEAVELTESVLQSIASKHHADIQWAAMSPLKRFEAMQIAHKRGEDALTEKADREADDLFDHYEAHREELDNADNRVFSFPKSLDVNRPGSKMPVVDISGVQ